MPNFLWVDPTPENTCPICIFHRNHIYSAATLPPLPAHIGCECYAVETDQTTNEPDWNNAPLSVANHWLQYIEYLRKENQDIPASLVASIGPLLLNQFVNDTIQLRSQPIQTDGQNYFAQFITEGYWVDRNGENTNVYITADAIRDLHYRQAMQGAAMFPDHADSHTSAETAAVIQSVDYQLLPDGRATLTGTFRFWDTEAGQAQQRHTDAYLTALANNQAIPDQGVSADLNVVETRQQNGRIEIIQFGSVESVDFVHKPGAEGRILAKFTALGDSPMPAPLLPDPETPLIPPVVTDEPPAVLQTLQLITPAVPPAAPVADEWAQAVQLSAATTLIANSGLPAPSITRLQANAANYANPAALQTAINAERDYIASLSADTTIQLGSRPAASGMVNGLDRLQLAAEALISGTRAEGAAPLSGIRELYMQLSGDYEMKGVFDSDRVQFASVTSATMANLTANALNKVVINMFEAMPQFWQSTVTEQDFNSLQAAKWMTLGGIGELPTVDEGASYDELAWSDQSETTPFIKKGGYLGLTLEAIDKDDTGKLMAAPRALSQAAYISLAKAYTEIFTANAGAGQTMSDGKALFHADHANLGTTALSYAAFVATRLAMRKQTQLGSGDPLGALVTPKQILVPNDLEATAIQLLLSEGETGTANNDENMFASGNARDERYRAAARKVVVNDFLTDANDWVAVADPTMYPSIGLGYRFGRTPEVFSLADPNSHLMFAADTMPIKVRFFFAIGATDWRGMYKNIVA